MRMTALNSEVGMLSTSSSKTNSLTGSSMVYIKQYVNSQNSWSLPTEDPHAVHKVPVHG
jgi:hypothetical protein